MMFDYASFAERLRRLRLDRMMTQEKMARTFGIRTVHYAYMEMGKLLPGLPLLVRMAKFFGVTTDYLLGIEALPAQTKPAV